MTVTAADVDALLDRVPTGLLIDGEWVRTTRALPVENPATEDVLVEIADAGTTEAGQALDAAVDAQESWAATDPRQRGEILRKAFELITARADDFALLMTLEMGKPLAEARGEVTYGAEFLRWFSEEAVRIAGRYSIAPAGGTRLLTMKQPVGPVYAITPWNFPLAMGTRKIGPALAAGCTAVIKPAAQTPLTTLAFAAVLQEAGLPDGVVNVITTSSSGPTSEPIIADPRLRKLTFTGSTEVGQRLIAQSAEQVLQGVDGARRQRAVPGLRRRRPGPRGGRRDAGQDAQHRRGLHGGEPVHRARVGGRRVRPPVRGTDGGAEDRPRHRRRRAGRPADRRKAVDKVSELVADAVDYGARVLTGGNPVGDRGYFYAPTVLVDVPPTRGPLPPGDLRPGRADHHVQHRRRGPAAGQRHRVRAGRLRLHPDLTRAITVAERLQTGMVGINQGIVSNPAAPFGGVKQSGLGREGGVEGIEEYLETKYVGIALEAPEQRCSRLVVWGAPESQ